VSMSESKVLVTGASGFIGRTLCKRLSESGHRVVGSGRREGVGPWQSFMSMDLTCTQSELKLDGIKTVFHLASKAHAVSEAPGDTSGYNAVIVEGTRRLVAAAERANVHSLVYMSSVKAMGEGESRSQQLHPLDESCSAKPETPYGLCKLEAESIVLQSKIPHVVVLRPVMVYGPGHKGNLVKMAEAIRVGRFPPIADNKNRRSMVHVDDLVGACELAAVSEKANREVYVIAGEAALSTRQLYDALRREMKMRPVRWGVPGAMLLGVAKIGDFMESITGKRMPLSSDIVWKLLGSAWYSNQKSKDDLGLVYRSESRFLD
jgi:UDP-glucose 4-epimerase